VACLKSKDTSRVGR